MSAVGVLEADHVLVADPAEANRLHNKGFFGDPQSGNSLRLSRQEAAYNVRQGRLTVEGADFADLVDTAYFAYADLRDRGLVARHDGDGFIVWPRGQGPKDAPWFRARVMSERDAVGSDDLEPGVLCVVDEDGGVTHYDVAEADPEGTVMALDHAVVPGRIVQGAVLVAGDAFAREHIGAPHAEGRVLSFTEAEMLRRRGVLDVPDDLADRARAQQHHFDRTLPVYLDLRRRGVVARSGFRFGTHLRGYGGDPDQGHAPWLIQCLGEGQRLHWSELSRAVRLAHGVRKSFLVAWGDPVQYRAVSWLRP